MTGGFMDGIQITGLAITVFGLAIVLVQVIGVIFGWAFIPANVFIIGLGLIVIGLVMIWNQTGDRIGQSS
jgi:hypothetical protein